MTPLTLSETEPEAPPSPSPASSPAEDQPTERPRPNGRDRRRRQRLAVSVLSIVLGCAAWQVIASLGWVDPLFLPKLTDVLDRLRDMAANGQLADAVLTSGKTLVSGLAIAVLLGTLLGLFIASNEWIEATFWPWVMAINSVPRIAFIPLIFVIFGLGQTSQIVVVTLASAFPMIVNVDAGVKSVDPLLRQMAQHFGAGPWLVFRRLVLPASIPYMLAGFRIAISQGLIGVVVAELFGSSQGVGFQLFKGQTTYDITLIYAMMIVLAILGVALSQGAKRLEGHYAKWKSQA
jgi:ABC-type nitrate/sulfonate/bicarbonate transport system permease component